MSEQILDPAPSEPDGEPTPSMDEGAGATASDALADPSTDTPTETPEDWDEPEPPLWTPLRIVTWLTRIALLGISTLIAMKTVHPGLILSNNTPTGGDMGAHVWGPAYLRDHLLSNWKLNGWTMDWYSGFPIYRFYMVVPALMITILNVVLPYGIAFKIVAVLGIVTLPACCYAFGKPGSIPVPRAGDVRRGRADLPARRELHDLRRQHRLDDGRRVLVLDRPVVRHARLRAVRQRDCRPATTSVKTAVVLALAVLCHGHRRDLRVRRPRADGSALHGQAAGAVLHHHRRNGWGCCRPSGRCRSS